ncbi:MAG: hypothetical protein GY754_03565 [bacterium]|nr:hypothetical protein [bacterium]
MQYLKLIYTPEEAAVVKYLLPLPKFLSTEEIAASAGMNEESVKSLIDSAHKKNGLSGMGNMYALPPIPILLNIHQFHSETGKDDLKAANLYLDFFIEKKYSRYYETSEKGTPVFRTVPIEKSIKPGEKVLSYEEAEQYIMSMEHDNFSLVPCPCRTRTDKLGVRECKEKFPIAHCLMLGVSSMHFESIGMGKKVSKPEAVSYIKEMIEKGLICCTDNAMAKNSIICLCCGCCCSQIRGRTKWDNPDSVAPSNFIPQSNDECIACGKCEKRCLLEAITINKEEKRVEVNADKCIGCGVCTVTCSKDSLRLIRLERSETFPSGGKMLKAINLENVL